MTARDDRPRCEMSRPLLALTVAATLTAGLAGCRGREISMFGYTSAPAFDPDIRSVYIPVFKNVAFHTTPYRGIEARLTEAIVQELNARRTPIRVVSDPAKADTELIGTITSILKQPLNRNAQNHNREFDVVVSAEVVWRDLRSGKVLSGVRDPSPNERQPGQPGFDPSIEPPGLPPPVQVPVPVVLTSTGRTIAELGESSASGEQMALKRLARQIVNMMEAPW